MTLAYFDLANGISGDMILGALAHAGRRLDVDAEAAIAAAVASIDLDVDVGFVDDERGGLACVRAEVKSGDARFTANELRSAIAAAADTTEEARARATAALDLLVEAEAAVHGVDPDDVHLHELASADTAADLLGAAVGLEALGATTVAAAAVPVPSGWIASEHGALPLPAPVTLELLRGARLRGVEATTELVTPSGAAVLAACGASFGPLPAITLDAVGVGAGSRRTSVPNICRVLIGRPAVDAAARLETCVLLETNIDDQTPEGVGHAIEQLLAGGALDVWVTPIVMKRSRPAFQLSALVTEADEGRIVDRAFRLTTTLGIRRTVTTRWVADREIVRVSVGGQTVDVKIARIDGDVVNIAPEFRDCVRASEALSRDLKDVFAEAADAARRMLDGRP